MKIAPRAAETYLSRPDAGHYAILLYGPDSGLVRERAKRLADTMLAGGNDPFALNEFSEDKLVADPALLSDELSAIGLGGRRVIMLRDAGDKLTKIIEDAAAAFHNGACLIVCAGELSARSSLRGWFEKENTAAAIACYKDEARDVADIIRKSFEAAGIRASRDVMEYLPQQLGNDRYVTRQELEKLITYAGEAKQLELSDVQALVDYNRETGFDDLVNAVADRNVQALEKMLTLLLREAAPPVAYLRALQRYFNRLYAIRSQMDTGQSAEQVIAALRPPVFFRQAPITTRHAQNWTIPQIVKALKLLIAAEAACKTSDLPIIPASTRRLLQVTQVR